MWNWIKKIFAKHKTLNHKKEYHKVQTPYQSSEDRDKEIRELILLQDDI